MMPSVQVSSDRVFFTHTHGEAGPPPLDMDPEASNQTQPTGAQSAGAVLQDQRDAGMESMEMGDMDVLPAAFGPLVHFQVTVPKPGSYLVIGQLHRGADEVIIAPFVIACGA